MTIRALFEALRLTRSAAASFDLPADARLDVPCSGVTHDSRRVSPGMVFVALRGLKADGASFAGKAIAQGAAAIVAERSTDTASAVPWIVVPDARLALAHLAAAWFRHPSRELRVVGTTGTNGKTTTSHLLAAIIETSGARCGVTGTVAHRIVDREIAATHTTPEAPDLQDLLRQMVSAGCGYGVMEVSSHALALRRVDGIQFAAGIFTNLTRDHLDFHADMEDYFASKRRLFELLPDDAPALINLDDPRGAALMEVARRPIGYAINRPADVSPGPLAVSLDGLSFDARLPQGVVRVRSRLVGRPNVYNILAAAGTAAALGIPLDAIERGIAALAGVPGRFEKVSSESDDITVIVDYAHTDDALRNLLETARPLATRRLLTVFGAGGDRDRSKRPLMGMVAARLSDVVIITSDNPRTEDPGRIIEEVRRGAEPESRQRHGEVLAVLDRREAIAEAIVRAQAGDLVLLAGKGHEKYQEIDGRRLPFDEVAIAREALDARRLKSRAG